MDKKTLRDVDLKGKRVVMRVDFNVPIKEGVIKDDTRIKGALPSIQYVLDNGGSLVLMSHLGRPAEKGYEADFSLKPVAEYLAKMLGRPVAFAPDCANADKEVAAMKPGDVLMLENTRFYKEEQGKLKQKEGQSDEEFKAKKAELKEKQQLLAKKFASYGDIYCNDAFGSAHRAHASTAVITKFMPVSVAGFLMEKEIAYLGSAVENPVRPFVAILGGAKVSDKLAVVQNLLGKVDTLIIGGGMAYTFFLAQGMTVGQSLKEEDWVERAGEMLKKAEAKGVKILLPIDNRVADHFGEDAVAEVVPSNAIPDDREGMDIGPKTEALYAEAIKGAKTVFWNGPMGVFEFDNFAHGTEAVCRAVAESDCTSIIGGGDSVAAVNKFGLADKMSWISTGGGASMELVEGKALPGVEALLDA